MKESNLRKQFLPKWQLENGMHSHLFRNNTGGLFAGKTTKNPDGSITIHNPVRVAYGVGLWRRKNKKSPFRPVGGGDDIGWTNKIVTQEMVGQPVAIFTSIEHKTKNVVETKDQKDWKELVLACGGIARVVREEV